MLRPGLRPTPQRRKARPMRGNVADTLPGSVALRQSTPTVIAATYFVIAASFSSLRRRPQSRKPRPGKGPPPCPLARRGPSWNPAMLRPGLRPAPQRRKARPMRGNVADTLPGSVVLRSLFFVIAAQAAIQKTQARDRTPMKKAPTVIAATYFVIAASFSSLRRRPQSRKPRPGKGPPPCPLARREPSWNPAMLRPGLRPTPQRRKARPMRGEGREQAGHEEHPCRREAGTRPGWL